MSLRLLYNIYVQSFLLRPKTPLTSSQIKPDFCFSWILQFLILLDFDATGTYLTRIKYITLFRRCVPSLTHMVLLNRFNRRSTPVLCSLVCLLCHLHAFYFLLFSCRSFLLLQFLTIPSLFLKEQLQILCSKYQR